MAPAGPGSGFRDLAALLRAAGFDPCAQDIADALWLAGRMTPRHGPSGPPGPAAAPAPPSPAPAAGPGERLRPPAPPARAAAADGEQIGLHAPDPRPDRPDGAPSLPGPGVPVRVPGAGSLPRVLDVQRALRVLQRHRPPAPPAKAVLDEPATAEASARALGLVIPVLRPESRREATVRLVMDASPSMAVWQDMFEELRSVCERLGAFRDVQVHHLHRLDDGRAALGRGPVPGPGLRSGEQLRDPTGRALTIVVSDCAGPLWREGRAQRLLYRWAQCTPCVVVQPLPQRLWARSRLPTERGALSRIEGGGGRLRFGPDRPPLPGRPTGGLAVPVLPPNATALGAWARLVAGLGTGPVPAEVGRVLARHPAVSPPQPRAVRPPRELVARFRATAAPQAVQLAVYLSAAPLTLPVMRLVQRTMLPDSEPSDLAEVLLSGLLRRSGPEPGQWYEFVPGVQDVLLGPLGRDEAALVLKHCSEYLLAHFGRGVRNFPALAVAQLTGVPVSAGRPGDSAAAGDEAGDAAGRVPGGQLPQAFAQVSAKVVRRYLPGPPEIPPQGGPPPCGGISGFLEGGRARAVRAARDRLADGEADGDARALYEAVAVLRHAVTAPPGPGDPPGEAETELAGALLRLWDRQRDPGLLTEAERAVTGIGTGAARAALGRVLYERAVAVPGPPPGPGAQLLAAADREFAAAMAAPEPAPGLRLECAVRRARALIRLSALRGDPGALLEARAALEPLAGPPPPPELVPAPDPDDEDLPAADPDAPPAGRAPDPYGVPYGFPRPDTSPAGDPDADTAEAAGAAGPGSGRALHLALGRVLLALLPHTPDPAERTALAGLAAARLAVDPGAGRQARARVRVELAGALRHLPGRLEEAARQLAAALDESAGEPELRLTALVCLARVHRARYARDADPAALEAAAGAYARARRLIPRDGEAFGELLPEWGEVLLDRARADDGRRFTGAAVRVLRESRAAAPQSDPRTAHRLRRLATGLRLRYAYEGDLVDLREAEYLLEVAVRQGREPLERARAWRDHGDVQREIHAHTRAADRLDRAADSYRRAGRAALEAAGGADGAGGAGPDPAAPRDGHGHGGGGDGDGDGAVALAAGAQEARGEVLERLTRPRAALDAYRAALELWQRLGPAGAERHEAVRVRVRTLEARL